MIVTVAFGAAVPAAGVSLPVIPDGVTVSGVPVGGMISVAAERQVAMRFGRPVRLFHGDRTWAVRPSRLGASAAIKDAVREALAAKPKARVRLRIDVRRSAVRRFVARLNRRVDVPATDSKLVGLSNLAPAFTKARPGRTLDQPTMVRWITRSLRSTWRDAQLELQFLSVAPKVTPADYGPIVVMERNPTWNPPDSEWAKDAEPIPPGPGNPLGTRWMGISSPAVGIHGTPDAASIGYSVSHGCIRMKIPEAEWLFEHVDVGTPVYIVSA